MRGSKYCKTMHWHPSLVNLSTPVTFTALCASLVLAPWALHFLFLRTPSHQCLASAQYSARNEVEGSKEAAQHPSDPSTSALTAEENSFSAASQVPSMCQACAQHALRVQALICERQAEHEARLRAEHQLRKLQAVLSPTAKASRVQIAKLNASKSLALLKLADQVAIDDNTPRLHTASPAAAVPAAALAAACIRAPIGTPSSAPVQAHSKGPGATLSSPVHATPCTTVTKATEQVPTAISGSPPATPSHNPAPTLPHPLAAPGPSAFSAPSPVSPTTASSAPGAGAVSKGHRAQPPPLTPTFGDRAAVFAFRPIGYLQSCFTTRNGTPRQPLLVSQARARLVLDPELPQASLDGLTQWSHVWVLYVFHDNTESRLKAGTSDWSGLKAKVHVPRLNGAKQGVFATRTPHRPSPIGLSVAQVISVHNNTVVLGGADIVDGSPVLDLKPYLPFCDSLPGAMAPCYVQAELDGEEPLAVSQVHLTDTAATQLTSCWAANQHRSLYSTPSDFIKLVTQVLARDIRSLRQRLHEGAAAQARNLASTASAAALTKQRSGEPGAAPMSPAGSGAGVFHVVIEGVDVSYDITDDGPRVLIGGASLTSPLAQQHALKHRG
ncbi:TsaA-like domain-containing protein [Haematococcus lacustris]